MEVGEHRLRFDVPNEDVDTLGLAFLSHLSSSGNASFRVDGETDDVFFMLIEECLDFGLEVHVDAEGGCDEANVAFVSPS